MPSRNIFICTSFVHPREIVLLQRLFRLVHRHHTFPVTSLISNETWVCRSEHVVRSSAPVRERVRYMSAISGTIVAFGCLMFGD